MVIPVPNLQLGVGPMSREIIKSITEYPHPIYIVASRNQVDHDSGYVCTTAELADLAKHVELGRDHCGPYFADCEANESLAYAMLRCRKTIRADVKAGFKYMHIDMSRVPADKKYECATDLIEFALDLNPYFKLEFGSEENNGSNLDACLKMADQDLEFLQKYKQNVVYYVNQTGSYVREVQTGIFDLQHTVALVRKTHSAGFKFKEHNADYLRTDQLDIRSVARIDAMNIAPMLGSLQTQVIQMLCRGNKHSERQLEKFKLHVLSTGKWRKWTGEKESDYTKFRCSAHYAFNSLEYQSVVNSIHEGDFNKMLSDNLHRNFDSYLGNPHD